MNQHKHQTNGHGRNTDSLYKAQVRRQNALADRDELSHRIKTGELVHREAVEKAWFQRARALRDALQNIPARIAGLVAPEKKQDRCFDIIKREIDQALESFVGGPP